MQLLITGLTPQDADQLASIIKIRSQGGRIAVAPSFPDIAALAPDSGPVLCGYSSPGLALARAALDGAPVSSALASWCERAEAVLAGYALDSDRVILIDIIAAHGAFSELMDRLRDRLRSDVEALTTSPPPVSATEALLSAAAEPWARRHDKVDRLVEGLHGAAITPNPGHDAGVHRRMEADLASVRHELQEIAQKSLEAEAERRNEALSAALDLCRADLARALAQAEVLSKTVRGPVPGIAALHRLAARFTDRFRRKADLEMICSSGLFDPDWYRDRYPDVRHEGDPALHYLIHGGREGRPAGPGFSSSAYFDLNPDLRGRGLNPLVHYLRSGRAEGRAAATADGRLIDPTERSS